MTSGEKVDKQLGKEILIGMMKSDLAILEKGLGKQTPNTQREIIRLYKIAIKCVRGSR